MHLLLFKCSCGFCYLYLLVRKKVPKNCKNLCTKNHICTRVILKSFSQRLITIDRAQVRAFYSEFMSYKNDILYNKQFKRQKKKTQHIKPQPTSCIYFIMQLRFVVDQKINF